MTHGSLFSGIGGFDLAAEWMGWENIFHCEWNKFGQQVLKYYWPKAISYEDITKTDFTIHRGNIDIITGGFPCQPYSTAGKRLGKDDDRHLFPEMLRAIREIAPRFVVGENVRGLTNWNGGMVFDEVCADLENLGYQVAPVIIPACAVNAPHKRERIWFVAYSNKSSAEYSIQTRRDLSTSQSCNGNAPHPNGNGFNQRNGNDEINASEGRFDLCERQERRMHANKSENAIWQQFNQRNARSVESTSWDNFPTQSPICGGDDGLPTELDGITFSKWRNESIKAYGNAVCPQLVLQIFKAIEQYEKNQTRRTRCC